MTEETKRNKKKWDESEAWFNKEYPDHDDGCLYGKIVVKAAYTAGTEPREKQIDELKAQTKVLEQNLEDTEICENGLKNRIAELEDKLANADYQLEGRDLEIKELKAQLEREKNLNQCMTDNNEQLREQIEKMKCCGNCVHCKYSPSEESYEWCEKHDQIVNIAVQPCCEYKRRCEKL